MKEFNMENSNELKGDSLKNTISIIKDQFKEFFLGIFDSLKIFSIYNIIANNPKILNNIKNCLILNGFLFIGSMILYNYLINPCVEFITNKISILGYLLIIGKYFYFIFWLIPVYLICNVITTFWIDEIYAESLKLYGNDNIKIQGQNFVTNITNQIERLIIVISFIIFLSLINFLNFLPGIFILKYITLCLLNSLYVFEYILLQNYLVDYKTIIYFLENKFFYFLGYGILLTIMINIIESVTINSAIFLIAFPFFLITSIQVSQLRFQNCNVKKNLIFFFLIEKFYLIGLKIVHTILYFFKNRRNLKIQRLSD